MQDSQNDAVATQLARVAETLERLASASGASPSGLEPPDWSARAFRWRAPDRLEAITRPHQVDPDQLLGIDTQKETLFRNTQQFLADAPANDALLWGARGTGKSSLIKSLLARFADSDLRLIEIDAQDLIELPRLTPLLAQRPERFIIFVDDLSFEAQDASYKALKAMLDGSLAVPPDNVILYATSNRRHLMPEFHADNASARIVNEELHHGEAVEEKISLSDRFGLWLSFHPYSQAQYLDIVAEYLNRLIPNGPGGNDWRDDALAWALLRGSRSGRTAWQFARDYAGRNQLPGQD